MNQRILFIILVVVAALVVVVYGKGFFLGERRESPQVLAQVVLSSSDPQARQVAAGKLAALAIPPAGSPETPAVPDEVRQEVVRVYKESKEPACRAAMIESVAHGYDYDSMPLILDALESPDPLISGRANVAVGRMLNAKVDIRPEDTVQERKRKVAMVRARWADLEKSPERLATWKKRQKELEAEEKKRRG